MHPTRRPWPVSTQEVDGWTGRSCQESFLSVLRRVFWSPLTGRVVITPIMDSLVVSPGCVWCRRRPLPRRGRGVRAGPVRRDLWRTCPPHAAGSGLCRWRGPGPTRDEAPDSHWCAGPAHGLAVYRDHCSSFDGAGTRAEPAHQVGINVSGVLVLRHPPDSRLRRKNLAYLHPQGL